MLIHESGALQLDLARGQLWRRGQLAPLTGRAYEVFAVLETAGGELVSKDELMRRVWPGGVVEENTLQVHISAIRKALGDDNHLLKTLSGRGYRLTGKWVEQSQVLKVVPSSLTANDLTSLARRKFKTNLAVPISVLVGRTAASTHLLKVLSTRRLITLAGPGGIGKTALALELGRAVYERGERDVCVVDLAPLTQPTLVPSSIAHALELEFSSAEVTATQAAEGIGRRPLLLILDNCEHLIDAAALVAEAIVHNCPGTTVIATSRESLRIEGEYIYRVSPLSVPSAGDTDPDFILAQSAVQLFLSRMSLAHEPASMQHEDLITVASICRRLDGIPLAIEFAAARVLMLGLKQVAAGLDDRFGLLTAGRRTALPRHQTLLAALDWSYELLPENERRLLRRSAIYPAGFSLAAAAAVFNYPGEAASSVPEGIANLVDKSLLTFDGLPSAGRWRLLETIRAYALEKLAEAKEYDRAVLLAAEYLRDLFRPPVSGQALPALTSGFREIDNIRAAVGRGFLPEGNLTLGLELLAISAPLWFELSLMTEYRVALEEGLNRLARSPEPQDAIEMRLQTALGHSHWYTGPDSAPAAMEQAFTRALRLSERIGDAGVKLQALWGAWAIERGKGNHVAALEAAMRYWSFANEVADRPAILLAERSLAHTHHDLGNQRIALKHVDNVLNAPAVGKPTPSVDLQVDARVAMFTVKARAHWLRGFPDQAVMVAREAIDIATKLDHSFSIGYAIFTSGCPVSLWTGDLNEAQDRIEALDGQASWAERLARICAAIIALRRGSAANALTAAYFEPRLHFSSLAALAERTSSVPVPLPAPEDIPSDLPWSLPEVLRVDAELLLYRGGNDAHAAAELKLLKSLELAAAQSALSWELRAAMSLTRLRITQGRVDEGKDALDGTYRKFTEGFETLDLRSARTLIDL